ncbi:cuticle protein AMP4-like [Homarus americanus]|uniref:cuticle protein AMP4-like n=1 Tax=Homarus americanus TaxID=6706 RepID=UPI001C455A87|nr:cuticle protein AMP4-like [Homarus americanus]
MNSNSYSNKTFSRNMAVLVVMMVLAGVVAAQDAAPPAAQLRVVTPGGKPVVGIVRNLQHAPDVDGSHSSDFEAENGIQFQFSGSQGATGGANMVGHYSYPLEDGKVVEVQFVADENGFQPQSDLLPVAPAFPHPIPQFVLDQIAFAEAERERKAREGIRDEYAYEPSSN